MASVDVHTAVESLPPATATMNEEARQSTEPFKTAKPLEGAQASVAKDIAQMSVSDKIDTIQHSETQQGMSAKPQEEHLPLPTSGSKDLIRLSEQPESPHQDLKASSQDVEKHDKHQMSLEQLPRPGNVADQQLKPGEPAKKTASKDGDSDSSSSEDERKEAKGEKKHTFGLSQAISSGFAGAAAGAASSLTGAATSAVLGAMHGKIGTPKPAPAQEEKKIEKTDSAKPSTEASQGQQKAAKDDSTKHHHSHHHGHHHHHSSHGDEATHAHDDAKESHHSHSKHLSSHEEHPEGSHHEHSHSHDGHSHSRHEHSHEKHDHSKEPATQSSHESGHTHHHHSSSQHHR